MNFIVSSDTGSYLCSAYSTGTLSYANTASISNDGGHYFTQQTLPSSGSINNISSIATNSTGTTTYITDSSGFIYQYLKPGTCLMENSKISTINGEINIQDLKKGDLIKSTYNKDGINKIKYIPLEHLGYGTINFSNGDNLFEVKTIKASSFSSENLPTEDIFLTRMHSILVNENEKEKYINENYINNIKYYEKAIKIEGYEKILAAHCNKCINTSLDDMKEKFGEMGKYYHIVLLDKDDKKEHAIFVSGIPVESCSKKWFDKSELTKIF